MILQSIDFHKLFIKKHQETNNLQQNKIIIFKQTLVQIIHY